MWFLVGLFVIWAPAGTLLAIRHVPPSRMPAAAGRPTASGSQPPAAIVEAAYVPTFETSLGDVAAGCISVVRLEECDTPVAISALHLLGPAGGLPKEVAPRDVARVVRTLTIDRSDLEGDAVTMPARVIPLPNTAPLGSASRDGDIVAFWVSEAEDLETNRATLRLAAKTPAPGEQVWLLAFADSASDDAWLHRATVESRTDDGLLWYRFDDPAIPLRGTSGAALIDERGDVVAVHLGGAAEGGAARGCGNPVTRFGPALREAVRSGCNAVQPPADS